MPAAAHPSTAVSVTRPVCSSCGAQGDPGSLFCTECGKGLNAESAPVEETASAVAAAFPSSTEDAPVVARPDAIPQEPIQAVTPSTAETTPVAVVAEPSVDQNHLEPAPQVVAPVYAAPSEYPPAQPGGAGFRVIVLVLLLLIVIGGFGGWYFMGVETVIVCSPPDVTVFLDDKELPPTSYGRYVVPHLSRQPHLLKVQRAGFADTIERLDFPLTSLHEWVNIKLVPRRPARSSSRQH